MSDATDNIEFHEGEPNRGDAFIEKLNRMAEGSLLALLAQAGGGIGLKKTPGGGMYFYLDPPIQGAADVQQETHVTPYALPIGTGATPETTTWDRSAKPSGKDSVIYTASRMYYDSSNGKVWSFVRNVKVDSLGAVYFIDVEVGTNVYTLGICI